MTGRVVGRSPFGKTGQICNKDYFKDLVFKSFWLDISRVTLYLLISLNDIYQVVLNTYLIFTNIHISYFYILLYIYL